MTCLIPHPKQAYLARRAPGSPAPSIVRATLARNGAARFVRAPLREVTLSTDSRIVALNGSRVWCCRYAGLAGLFRKDRGPSKEFGRLLCDDVKARFRCDGFLTTDELPRYGIDRAAVHEIRAGVGANPDDCVLVYAYPEALCRAIDEHLGERLRSML